MLWHLTIYSYYKPPYYICQGLCFEHYEHLRRSCPSFHLPISRGGSVTGLVDRITWNHSRRAITIRLQQSEKYKETHRQQAQREQAHLRFCEKYSAGPEQGRLFPLVRGAFLVRKEGSPERKLLQRGSDALSALLSRSSCFHFALHDSLRDTRPLCL
jgi:hypothetical protein